MLKKFIVTLLISAIVIILLVAIFSFYPFNQKISWFAPGYSSPERIELTLAEQRDIFYDEKIKPKIILDEQHLSGIVYSVSKSVGSSTYDLVLTKNTQSVLFQFPLSQNRNLPQVYEQDDYLVVLTEFKVGVLPGTNSAEFVVYNKSSKIVKIFSIILPATDDGSYAFDWFDQKVGNVYPMHGSVFSIYQDKLFLPLKDLSGRNPALVYIYNIESSKVSRFDVHGDYCNKIDIAIKDGKLFSAEGYFNHAWLFYSEPPSFLQPKCFIYERNI